MPRLCASKETKMIPLHTIKVASPCHADWDRMEGDSQVRFCGGCRKNIYNLSEMDSDEAQALVSRLEGRVRTLIYPRRRHPADPGLPCRSALLRVGPAACRACAEDGGSPSRDARQEGRQTTHHPAKSHDGHSLRPASTDAGGGSTAEALVLCPARVPAQTAPPSLPCRPREGPAAAPEYARPVHPA